MSTKELLIRNARILDEEGLHTITVEDGHIAAVTPAGSIVPPAYGGAPARPERSTGAAPDATAHDPSARHPDGVIDADGHLVTPSFVNGHMHLCKTYTYDEADPSALDAYAAR